MRNNPNPKPTDKRKQLFKPTVTADVARRKREAAAFDAKKIKRDENLKRRRREPPPHLNNKTPSADTENKIKNIEVHANNIKSNIYDTVHSSMIWLRKLLCIEKEPPIYQVIETGAIPHMVEILKRKDWPKLQLEAAWSLTNILGGEKEQAKVVIDAGAVPVLVELLYSPDEDVREQAGWAIGNIAGDSWYHRDLALNHGGMDGLIRTLNGKAQLSMLRNGTWALSNLCRGKPVPPLEKVRPAFEKLRWLIDSHDEEVVVDSCWAFSYLSEGGNQRIQTVLDTGVCPKLVELLSHENLQVVSPVLRTIGNIVTGDEKQTQTVIDNGGLPSLVKFLKHSSKGMRKDACWAISNIAAGPEHQVQAAIDANVFPSLWHILKDENEKYEIKKEAAWAVSNAASSLDKSQTKYIVHLGFISRLCDMLSDSEPKVVNACLECLSKLLSVDTAFAQLRNSDGLSKVASLQFNDDEDIAKKANNIIDKYKEWKGTKVNESLKDAKDTKKDALMLPELPNSGSEPDYMAE